MQEERRLLEDVEGLVVRAGEEEQDGDRADLQDEQGEQEDQQSGLGHPPSTRGTLDELHGCRCTCGVTEATSSSREASDESTTSYPLSTPSTAIARVNKTLAYSVVLLSVILLYLVSSSYPSSLPFTVSVNPARVGSGSDSSSTKDLCPDPYQQPGYFLHFPSKEAHSGRWIPYTDASLHAQGPAELPDTRDDQVLPRGVLETAPPNFYASLRDPKTRGTTRELQWLRSKTVIIHGCSVDRNIISGFCNATGGTLQTPFGDKHGFRLCRIPELDFEIQLWFSYGATFLKGRENRYLSSKKGPLDFESRVREYYRPKVKASGHERRPDLLLFATGTWDISATWFEHYYDAFTNHTLSDEMPFSWQELAFHRRRLVEMKSFLEQEYPGVPVLYRPPTYFYKPDIGSSWPPPKKSSIDLVQESVYRIHQSATILSQTTGFPLFSWADKLIGHKDYSDYIHIKQDSPATQLYIDMLLYYTAYHTKARRSHCAMQKP